MTAPLVKPLAGTLPGVVCRGLTKTFDGHASGDHSAKVVALRGIDLEIGRGELVMLMGPSGCGKTTLISILAGILAPDSGACVVLGQDLTRLDKAAKGVFRRERIGFVFQAFNLIPQLELAENVMIPLLLNRVRRETALARARDVLAKVGLSDRTRALPLQLSGGQQQRVAIARALVHDPQLIVCDEPTSALDRRNGEAVMKLLRGVADDKGRTLIVVTHDPRILGYADRVVHMDDGTIATIETPQTRAEG